jgi:fructokinase
MITVVGESLVDVVIRSDRDEVNVHPGGSPANVAVALSRLGQRTELVTQFGADDYGDLIRAHLETNGVEVVLAGRRRGGTAAPTSRALAHLDTSGGATYEFDLDWDVEDLRIADGSSALHVGSLGLALAPGDTQVLRLVDSVSRRGDVIISYDPNVRPSVVATRREAVARTEKVAAQAHVVKMSDEDAAFLFPGASPDQLATRLLNTGTRATQLLVITAGPRGAIIATRNSRFSVANVPVTVVDTVGAGDAFTAALLAGLADCRLLSPPALASCVTTQLESLRRIVEQAMAAAALTCTRPGADPPTMEELRRFMG